MSWRLSADALDYSPYDGRTLLVLISLASWADDDGSHIFPRVETLAKKARCSVRQAQRALRQLEQDGVLLVVKKGGGRSITEYKIDVVKLRAGQGCQNVTSDTSDAEKAENVTPEVTKPARHIDNRSITRSLTRSPSSAQAREGGELVQIGKGHPDRFQEFKAAVLDTWPGGFPKDNLIAAEKAWVTETGTSDPDLIVACTRLHGAEKTRQGQGRAPSQGKMLMAKPSTFLQSGGWKGYVQNAAQQREAEGKITTALGNVQRGLGADMFALLRDRFEFNDVALSLLDGVEFIAGDTPLFKVTNYGAKVMLENRGYRIARFLGVDEVAVLQVPAVKSA